jgi:ubiquinone/menaquinone biosynthesis C-methylase UbiE
LRGQAKTGYLAAVVLDETKKYYDEFSDWYERERHDGYHALVDRLESELALRYATNGRVLEAGCGTGLILRRVREAAREAHGIDLSSGMLRRAAQKQLSCAQGSVTALPFADDSFDLVYSFKVLAHVHPIVKTVRELVRVTRPGGHLLLEFYNARSMRYLIKRLRPALAISHRTKDDAVYTRYDSLDTIRGYFPPNVEIEGTRGVRVVVPLPQLLKLPLIGPALERLETWAADDPRFSQLGGFMIVIARKIG